MSADQAAQAIEHLDSIVWALGFIFFALIVK